MRRRSAHLHDESREAAGLPLGRSRRDALRDSAKRVERVAMTRTAADLGLLAAAFVAATALAELLGAANLGTAMTFGELGFVAALGLILLRRRRR